jgi:hypothetical protein
MKREDMTLLNISNAVLATRYLALQELREKVRIAEERVASTRLTKVSFLQPPSRSDADTSVEARKS